MPPRPAEARPVARILRAAFSVALVCLVLAGVAGFATLAVTVRSFSKLIERELPLLVANGEILQGLTDAETAERGFLLTGDATFLDPYEPGIGQFLEAVGEAERLADTPELRALIAAQDESARAWISEFAEPVIQLRSDDPDAAIALARSGAGERRFEQLRAQNSQTEAHIRDRVSSSWVRALVSIWVAGTILSALVIITLSQGVRAAARATDAVTGPLGRLVGTLERLSAGDLSARADVRGPSEIAAVAQALNDLADENERLSELNRQRLTVAGRIRRVAAQLHSQLQVDPVLACAVSEAGRILADRAVVHRIHEGEHEVMAAWCGPAIPPLSPSGPLPYPDSLLAELGDYTHGQQVVEIADVETDQRFDRQARDALLSEGIRAAMLAQLRGAGVGERLILAVHTASVPRSWSSIDVALFEGIVREARDALANASAFEQQQGAVQQLRRLDEEKSAFLSNVSHELRTPLTSIIGYVELLETGDAGPLSKDQVGLVKTVSRNSKRLLDLIEELLLLSRIESGTFTMARDPIALADVVRDVVDTLRPQFLGLSPRLRVEVAEDIGTVLGDRHQLERVLFNLLTNAAKFTPAGGEVRLCAAREADATEVTVSDTGIGIPKREQGRVFDRFFRSSNAQEQAIEGTGLGLAITKSIVERHGGTIAVSSDGVEGTAFTVRLPLADAPAAQPAAR